MGVSDITEADWEEYYRNVNAFNIPNVDAKRVEIWDKAFSSTKTVRETLCEVYSKGFMDGVNDTSERFKSSAYKKKYDSALLDKVMQKSRTIIDDDGVMHKVVLVKDIEDMKAEVSE